MGTAQPPACRSGTGRGHFAGEIVPVGDVTNDQSIRGDTTLDKIRLPETCLQGRWFRHGQETRQPILHRDKDSMIQPTYYGSKRLGTNSIKGSIAQDY